MLTGAQTIVAGKFKDLLTESIVATATAHNSLSPGNKWYEDSKFCLVFKGSCLIQDEATFTPLNVVNLFILFDLDTW